MSTPQPKSRGRRSEIETKNLAPVQDVVREYRVIEDGAYAYNLQEQEIEHHYSQNVNMRRAIQEDLRTAKELQDEEDRKARIRTLEEEEEVKQMDEELAEIIQEQIFTDAAMQEKERKDCEERDKELALLLEETERRKAIEYAKRSEERDHHLAKQMEKARVTSADSEDGRRMRVMSDKELARRLQNEEELKAERDGRQKKELQSAVEMQDEELAKYIHERDIEKAEKMFRKAKKKGKHRNEPLYYDDNIDPPKYNSASNPPLPQYSNGHRQRRDDHRHRSHHHHHPDPRSHSGGESHRNEHRALPPPYDDRRGDRHSDRRHHGHRPHDAQVSREEVRHSPPGYYEQEGDRRDHDRRRAREPKPSRPPPPNHQNTEVKVPLGEPVRSSRERRDHQVPRRSSRDDIAARPREDYHERRGHSDRRRGSREVVDELDPLPSERRGHSDRHRGSREIVDELDPRPSERRGHSDRRRGSREIVDEFDPRPSPRSPSERDHKSTPGRTGKSPRQRAEAGHTENLPAYSEEDISNPNNGSKRKSKAKSECKQQ